MRWKWIERFFEPKPKRVLALSGGGARGLSHIGVLQEIDRLGLKPDLITGTSIGAIVGALYCLHGTSERLADATRNVVSGERFKRFGLDDMVEEEKNDHDSFSDLGARVRRIYTLSKMMRRPSIIELGVMEDVMHELFGEATFDDLKIPFAAVATDLLSGEDITLAKGSLATAVQASASIPGVFAPVSIDGMLLVDGGITRNVPIPETAEESEDSTIVVVDVMRGLKADGPFRHGVDILARTDWISQLHLNQFYLNMADLVIVPEVRNIHWADFKRLDQLIEKGRNAVLSHEKELVEMFG